MSNKTTDEVPETVTVCVTACQFAGERFVVDVNCQFTKLVGQENRRLAGGTREMVSVGDVASAVHAIATTHPEKQKSFKPVIRVWNHLISMGLTHTFDSHK